MVRRYQGDDRSAVCDAATWTRVQIMLPHNLSTLKPLIPVSCRVGRWASSLIRSICLVGARAPHYCDFMWQVHDCICAFPLGGIRRPQALGGIPHLLSHSPGAGAAGSAQSLLIPLMESLRLTFFLCTVYRRSFSSWGQQWKSFTGEKLVNKPCQVCTCGAKHLSLC